MPTAADIILAAEAFRVSCRTIRRWLAAGCDVTDPQAVAKHLVNQRAPSPAAMQAAHELLTKNQDHEKHHSIH